MMDRDDMIEHAIEKWGVYSGSTGAKRDAALRAVGTALRKVKSAREVAGVTPGELASEVAALLARPDLDPEASRLLQRVARALPSLQLRRAVAVSVHTPDYPGRGTTADHLPVARARGRRTDKLDEAKVRDIRARAARGEPLSRIADSHGVCCQTVRYIVNGVTWQHIK